MKYFILKSPQFKLQPKVILININKLGTHFHQNWILELKKLHQIQEVKEIHKIHEIVRSHIMKENFKLYRKL